MKLFFSRSEVPPAGWTYRNPRHFEGVEADVTHVAVEAGCSEIAEAYLAAAAMVLPLDAAAPFEPPPAQPSAEEIGKVLIPEDWRDLAWPTLRNLARALGMPARVVNRAEATSWVEAELARRATPEQDK